MAVIFIAMETIGRFWPGIIAKALIIPILFLLYLRYVRKSVNSFHTLILTALVFSWCGDVLLQLTQFNELFFLAGLGSFLLAQVMYLAAFFSTQGKNLITGSLSWALIPVAAYGAALLYYLWDGLGDMKIPVLVYAVVILTMLSAAINRKAKVNRLSFLLVLSGAILFVLSDSMIAVNKFRLPFDLARLAIMLTYVTAQYLIITGCLKQYDYELK
jgi:uncharacterized membrane protein YhhN